MSFSDPDRFHRAARDGHLDLLQEANRKDLNSRDEDGMTPAMWAAYYGRLDALRLIVGRGGDPDKCDHYGNTSLHCAAGNGHTDCVSFLVNFGVNLWALDNDFHTAKDVAVLNQRGEVLLRLLDQAQAKHALVNKKLVQRLREKSVYDAEKRLKAYRKMQAKAAKRAEKEDRSMSASVRKDSRFIYAPKFSDIVNVGEKKDHGAVSKKAILVGKKKKTVVFRPGDVIGRDHDDETTDIPSRASLYLKRNGSTLDSVKESDDGSTSPETPSRPTSDTHSSDDANSDVLQTADSGIGDELQEVSHVGIFDRPGFGTVAFRSSVVNLAAVITNGSDNDKSRNALNDFHCRHQNNKACDSIGSAGSLVRRHITWEDECDVIDYEDADDDATDEDEDDVTDDEDCCCEATEPLSVFLVAVGLNEYLPLFESEQIDLESLSLLSEEDLKALGMPLGPRRKLGKAIQQRIKTLEEPGIVQDSRL